jgi:hypothetical protein
MEIESQVKTRVGNGRFYYSYRYWRLCSCLVCCLSSSLELNPLLQKSHEKLAETPGVDSSDITPFEMEALLPSITSVLCSSVVHTIFPLSVHLALPKSLPSGPCAFGMSISQF